MGFAWVIARLPVSWSNGLGRGLGWLASRISPRRRQIALDNLTSALPEHSAAEIAAAMYQHFGLMIVEILRAAGGRPPPITLEGIEHVEQALEPGRGVIVLTGHVGNFELSTQMAAQMPAPVSVIIRQFTSPVAAAVLKRMRSNGPRYLLAGSSARDALRVLKRGEILVFVFDQHTPSDGAVWVPFFGRPAGTGRDLVRLAQKTGARIVPVFTWRRPGHHVFEAFPAVELSTSDDEGIKADTAKCTALIEAAIRREPAQWTWTHRRWKTPPRTTPTQSREQNG